MLEYKTALARRHLKQATPHQSCPTAGIVLRGHIPYHKRGKGSGNFFYSSLFLYSTNHKQLLCQSSQTNYAANVSKWIPVQQAVAVRPLRVWPRETTAGTQFYKLCSSTPASVNVAHLTILHCSGDSSSLTTSVIASRDMASSQTTPLLQLAEWNRNRDAWLQGGGTMGAMGAVAPLKFRSRGYKPP